jgi:hypothetical protein
MVVRLDSDLKDHFGYVVNHVRPTLHRLFPSLAFHFFSVGGKPHMIAVRVMKVHHHYNGLVWDFAKRGKVGEQQLWEEIPMIGFPDELFLTKCALIA